jgi:hypothetical protein
MVPKTMRTDLTKARITSREKLTSVDLLTARILYLVILYLEPPNIASVMSLQMRSIQLPNSAQMMVRIASAKKETCLLTLKFIPKTTLPALTTTSPTGRNQLIHLETKHVQLLSSEPLTILRDMAASVRELQPSTTSAPMMGLNNISAALRTKSTTETSKSY